MQKTNPDFSKLKLYLVRNAEGKFYRKVNSGSYKRVYRKHETCWTDSLKEAELYKNIAPANSVIGYFMRKHSEYPMPELVTLNVAGVIVEDNSKFVNKVERELEKKRLKYLAVNYK